MCDITEIKTFHEATQYLELFLELYDKRKGTESILSDLEDMFTNYHYVLLVAVVEGKPAGICGISFNKLIYSGKFIQLSNLFVRPEYRKSGIASKLIHKVRNIAKTNEIEKIMLDSYVSNFDSHKTYFREGFHLDAFHFALRL